MQADDGFFLGYTQQRKNFIVFNLKKQTTIESPHVIFDENFSAMDRPLNLTGDEIFSEYEHHHVDTTLVLILLPHLQV